MLCLKLELKSWIGKKCVNDFHMEHLNRSLKMFQDNQNAFHTVCDDFDEQTGIT